MYYSCTLPTVNTSHNGAALIAAGVEWINYIEPESSAEIRARIMAQLVSFKADMQLKGGEETGGLSCALSSISRAPEMYAYVCIGAIVMDNTARNSISLIKRIPFPRVLQLRGIHDDCYSTKRIRHRKSDRTISLA